VAALAGVSRTTVSFVLNERTEMKIAAETRRRVLDAARRLGYQPHLAARQLAGGTSQTIGLVLRQTPEQVAGDALLAESLHGLASAAREADHRVLVESLAPGEGRYADLVRSGRTDGLVVSGPRSDDEELGELVREGFPIVVQGTLPGLEAPSVDVDNTAGAAVAVGHLLGLGHRRIACVTNAPLVYTAAAARLAGYASALEGAGIAVDPCLVAEGDFDAASGHRAIVTILARATFDAVFVASDVVALGVLAGLREHGLRVPRDVSVTSFDDIPLAAFVDPPLTTMRLPARNLGFTAGSVLFDRIAGRPVADRTVLPMELILRSSTAPGAVAAA
jgi:LacI family transcriptional regulator